MTTKDIFNQIARYRMRGLPVLTWPPPFLGTVPIFVTVEEWVSLQDDILFGTIFPDPTLVNGAALLPTLDRHVIASSFAGVTLFVGDDK